MPNANSPETDADRLALMNSRLCDALFVAVQQLALYSERADDATREIMRESTELIREAKQMRPGANYGKTTIAAADLPKTIP
jgi:hypothetical protein